MSGGPLIPVTCSTIELKDLADTLDFEANGESGAVYALELTPEGYYKRVNLESIIPPTRILPTLDQLINTSSTKDEVKYALIKKGNRWALTPVSSDYDWLIKFEFGSPHTFIGNDNVFKKAINSGPLLVSLVPDERSRTQIQVKPYGKTSYLIHKIEDSEDVGILFNPPVVISSSMTMIIDLIARGANKKDISFMPNVTVSWESITEERQRILIFIQKVEGESKHRVFSTPQVTVRVENTSNTITRMKLNDIDLVAFYFSDKVFTEQEMELFVSKLKENTQN